MLLVEDEPDLRALAAMILELDGHVVVGVGTGEDALDLLTHREFDVLLLDIKLPGINGWEVLKRLGVMALDWPRPRVVVFSAHVGPLEAGRASELGADAYLEKPYDDDDLLRLVAGAA